MSVRERDSPERRRERFARGANAHISKSRYGAPGEKPPLDQIPTVAAAIAAAIRTELGV